MQIECPHCHTTYDIAEAAIGPQGRSVRCARCKTVWHAMPAAAEEFVGADRAMPSHNDMDRPDDGAGFGGYDDALPEVDSPPTAADHVEVDDAAPVPTSSHRGFGRRGKPSRLRLPEALAIRLPETLASRLPLDKFSRLLAHLPRWLHPGLTGFNVILVGLCAAIMVWRADIVRLMPQTATFFETIGLGVNLRGLVFTDTTIGHEMVGNTNVMLIEGAVQAIASKSVDVPRLRFGVQDANGQEIFSWTAILDQPYLRAGDKAFYKTRLAAPPAEARSVLVRFLNRSDVTPPGARPGRG